MVLTVFATCADSSGSRIKIRSLYVEFLVLDEGHPQVLRVRDDESGGDEGGLVIVCLPCRPDDVPSSLGVDGGHCCDQPSRRLLFSSVGYRERERAGRPRRKKNCTLASETIAKTSKANRHGMVIMGANACFGKKFDSQ